MLVFGAASQPWETLSPLQPANAGAAAGGAGIEPFVTDTSLPTAAAAAGSAPSVPPPTGLIGQGPLSPNVLGFLIWNQSQQSAATPWAPGGSNQAVTDGASNVPASPTGGQTDTGDVTAWAPYQSWFSPFSADGSGTTSSGAAPAFGGNGSTSPTVTSPNQPSANQALVSGEPDVPESSGAHGHHHHAGFAMQTQSDQSDPLANMFGASAQGASSTSATNADGSTTTTITYADGSEVTLTTAPQASTANATPTAAAAQLPFNANNFLETLIQLQARLVTASGAS